MSKTITIILAIVFALGMGFQVANAGTLAQDNNGKWVFSGKVVKGDAAKFNTVPFGSTVHMVSPGGSAMEGFRVGEVIEARGLKVKTFSKKAFGCFSACAIASAHAAEVDGALYFHKAFIPGLQRSMLNLRGFTGAQIDNAIMATNKKQEELLEEAGVSERTIKKFWKTKSNTFVKVKF